MIKSKTKLKKQARQRIKKRIRKKLNGASARPRICIFKSNKYIYVQAIDDEKRVTLAAASSNEKELRNNKKKNNKNIEISKKVGEKIAERLLKSKIKKVIFDRSGYPYHGRVKAVAEGARAKGLEF